MPLLDWVKTTIIIIEYCYHIITLTLDKISLDNYLPHKYAHLHLQLRYFLIFFTRLEIQHCFFIGISSSLKVLIIIIWRNSSSKHSFRQTSFDWPPFYNHKQSKTFVWKWLKFQASIIRLTTSFLRMRQVFPEGFHPPPHRHHHRHPHYQHHPPHPHHHHDQVWVMAGEWNRH